MHPPRNRSNAAGFTLKKACFSFRTFNLFPRTHKSQFGTDVYLYMTIGWFIWSKKVISGSLHEKVMLIMRLLCCFWVFEWNAKTTACFTSCPVERCVYGPAAGSAWTRTPVSWPVGSDQAPCAAAGQPGAQRSKRTSYWTCGCPESPVLRTNMWVHNGGIMIMTNVI